MAHVYIRNRSTSKWPDNPRFTEDLIPAAEALCRGVDNNQLWKILIREPDGNYKIFTGTGEKKLSEETNGKFKTEKGEYSCQMIKDRKLEDDQELVANEDLNVIDLIHGLNSERSGDILILLKESSYFEHWDIIRWGNQADHGGLHGASLKVPIIVAGRNVKLDPTKCREIKNGNHCFDVVRTVNIARTIADYLGFDDKLKEAKEALPVKFSQ